MEIYRSKDGQVSKYVHDDGSETVIKTASSCNNIIDPISGKIITTDLDRNKFSVFVSNSVGCPIGCKFCYLTIKKYPYYKLSVSEIYNNFCDALEAELEFKPELRDRYMKLSWMGMGDAFLRDPYELCNITHEMIYHANFINIKGLDGVDVSTVMPPNAKGWPYRFGELNDDLRGFKRNPANPENRSLVRLFYSLHSAYDLNRRSLIPCNVNLRKDLERLAQFRYEYGIDVICHHMFLDGINDANNELSDLIGLMNEYPHIELRILRFNQCGHSKFKESKKFDDHIMLLAKKISRLKYQISSGSEIKAACGQFLCLTNQKG